MNDWKLMLIAAFQKDRVIAWQFLRPSQTVNFQVYHDFLANVLHPAIRNYRIHRPLILQDNATPHKHYNVLTFISRHQWRLLRHPPYSPDLSPPDIDGFSRIKRPHKGIRYRNEAELKAAYEKTINEINVQYSFKGIQMLPCRWESVIQSGGEYII